MARQRLPVSVSSAVFIEDENGRLLLLKQAAPEKGGRWGPPAGALEAHEDPFMAAIRECREETGRDVLVTSLIKIHTIDRGDNRSSVGFAFRGAFSDSTEEFSLNPDEILEARFFTLEEVRQLIADDLLYKPEFNLDVLECYLAGERYPLELIAELTILENQQ